MDQGGVESRDLDPDSPSAGGYTCSLALSELDSRTAAAATAGSHCSLKAGVRLSLAPAMSLLLEASSNSEPPADGIAAFGFRRTSGLTIASIIGTTTCRTIASARGCRKIPNGCTKMTTAFWGDLTGARQAAEAELPKSK